MRKVVRCLFLGILTFVIPVLLVLAHPGRTDSRGCHTCRTNCANWGLSYGQYHCHNGGNASSSNSRSYNTTTKATTVRHIYGCMDNGAINYNANANASDGTCKYEKTETITETIYYDTKVEGNNTIGNKKVIQDGKNGEKQVVVKKIVDERGSEISRETISETISIEPVNEIVTYDIKTTKKLVINSNEEENSNSMPLIVTIIFLIINVIYGNKNKDTKLIINEIKKVNSWIKYILYLLYFIFVIPVFVDIVLVILDFIKKRRACF